MGLSVTETTSELTLGSCDGLGALLTQLFNLFYFLKLWENTHNLKFIILTIFTSTVCGHQVHLYCCAAITPIISRAPHLVKLKLCPH